MRGLALTIVSLLFIAGIVTFLLYAEQNGEFSNCMPMDQKLACDYAVLFSSEGNKNSDQCYVNKYSVDATRYYPLARDIWKVFDGGGTAYYCLRFPFTLAKK